jgi:hypothetical protein
LVGCSMMKRSSARIRGFGSEKVNGGGVDCHHTLPGLSFLLLLE